MKLRIIEKRQAIELRQNGLSYNEIRKIIPNLSKGTLSGWLKNIELTPDHRARIISKISSGAAKGRIKGAWTNKFKATERISHIQDQAAKEFVNLIKTELFIPGICLYWAEGAKRSRCFQFMNSDPEMIKLILKWLRDVLKVKEIDIGMRIFIHRVYEKENCELFWSEISGISISDFKKTVFKPTPHLVKKNENYKGCCRIEISKSEIFWKIQKWQEMIVRKLI
ncbi:MAG: hypothetical protein M1324_04325 [Patescibacteria group bacterium]|nr:hypothetical protein [Patescibacteria group bacterium]